jgi:hypothetical protein
VFVHVAFIAYSKHVLESSLISARSHLNDATTAMHPTQVEIPLPMDRELGRIRN